jgi:ribosomal protein S12 methylthiotransferase
MKSALSILPIEGSQSPSCSSVAVNINEPRPLDGKVSFAGRAAIVTLGCAKNQVDSEVMIGVLRNSGFEIVSELNRADVAVVNTCGFLESAVKESVDCVLELSELKKSGSLRRLLVAGCMVERYKGDIRKALPEVDSFIALDGLLSVGQAALGADESLRDILHEGSRPYFLYDDTMPRHLASRRHMAYVKVSEGCNRPCAFCIIPQIRGAMRSRSIESIVREVQALGAQGVREINLVAQDLTAFGTDRSEKLVDLLRSLEQAKAAAWIRLLYAYPVGVDDDLLSAIVGLPSVCDYLDVPLQHSSEEVLRAMKRPIGRFGSRRFVEYVRSKAPQIKLRTTFIVGFPGETEQDIKDLESFVADGHFESVGVFTYSPEPGTAACDLEGQVPDKEKRARRDRVMLAQQKVRVARNQEYVGKRLEVLVEGPHEETDMLLSGRARFQAPEVDGVVLINDVAEQLGTVEAGHIGQVEITEISGYDLVGTLVS